jgi:hypothetical protein
VIHLLFLPSTDYWKCGASLAISVACYRHPNADPGSILELPRFRSVRLMIC